MKLKINKTDYTIKTASLLTCKEYIALSKTQGNLLDYIAVVTGLEFKSVADTRFKDGTLTRLASYIGAVKDATSLPRSLMFYYAKKRQIITEEFNFESVGTNYLMQIKGQKTTNVLELMVYMLAIAIQKDYDSSKIDAIYEDLLNENYINVYSFIVFFFKNYLNGQNKKRISLIQRIQVFLIKMKERSKK